MVALGGNALIEAGQSGTYDDQRANAATMAAPICTLLDAGWRVVVVHGNGPQVGNLSIQQEGAVAAVPPQPLHQLCAMTQGQLGSVLVRAVDRRLGAGSAVAVITHVVVDPADPAFADPTKPVGPFFSREQATELAAGRGWQVREDSGRGYRRVVPSPLPLRVLEVDAIRTLAAAGHVVVAAGGGGIGVSAAPDGSLTGVDGVIDKDHAAAVVAGALGAQDLYLLTGVDAVLLDFGTPAQRPAHLLTADEAREHLAAGQFPPGSMGPKVTAALAFLDGGGSRVVITSAALLSDAVAGRPGVGTSILSAVPAMAASS